MVYTKYPIAFFLLLIAFINTSIANCYSQNKFTLAFGSCDNQRKENPFWEDIISLKPDVWVWGGDNIYADTYNMAKMEKFYQQQKRDSSYQKLVKNTPILATWDDHDYGQNDGGTHYRKKEESQQLFLDFLNVPKNSPRRKQAGIYHSKTFKIKNNSVKIITLDTRYFRTELTKGTGKKRYQSNQKEGSILGSDQWKWLAKELTNSTANFTVIVSSIQVLSSEHGFEKWSNFPNEMTTFFKLIETSKAKNVIILSGDRHISEFSKASLNTIAYPIIDFTSSGLTHAYSSFSSEKNKYRIGNVTSKLSYGVLFFDFISNKVTFQIRGKNKVILQEINQVYP
ncbi:alkaline phosphatase D family protein [Tenacibaculum finnmarkense]|uniref:Alkaline phosphatase n=1 Tax=Tenacibaculum finnmarkense genomovar ulcerans TaxID=2781388 RepID=A0A2I2M780_9FLAO|nr:alkaline phosphatase D family protein [Tenacibaculum finnmarkense]ALU74292.1 alkaline phosphatase [Tenacibaculum dicentrarchi]MBE7634861.1 alkaline phosphatase family protein [Tenacibaculum finnmarkense genomovar ulcerans]MBE7646386.1 alkaline phosphatase family protein [Tenacibaculum finnmarkense genomovar ulcerans]MBE7648529.1 alkaline phosphatase family protein [Tenacibaculum finnmarkense genomovar ulcerans]MBE7688591.1 alkaline phosphatase family protein [Tenacibaculum finnmarkense geno